MVATSQQAKVGEQVVSSHQARGPKSISVVQGQHLAQAGVKKLNVLAQAYLHAKHLQTTQIGIVAGYARHLCEKGLRL